MCVGEWPELGGRDPVSVLMELCTASKDTVEFTTAQNVSDTATPRFEVSTIINSKVFLTRQEHTKKMAKKLAAFDTIVQLFPDSLLKPEEACNDACKHPISELMEYAHTKKTKVSYTDLIRSGPDHKPFFSVSVSMNSVIYPAGEAGQKHLAKKLAAKLALDVITASDANSSRRSSIDSGCEKWSEKSGSDEASCDESSLTDRDVMTFTDIAVKSNELGQIRYRLSAVVGDETFPQASSDTESLAYSLAARMAIMVLEHKKQPHEKHITSELMESCQAANVSLTFLPFSVHGEDHIPIFSTAAAINSFSLPVAFGVTKKDCKMEASRIAYLVYFDKSNSFTREEMRLLCTPVSESFSTPPVSPRKGEPVDDFLSDVIKEPTSVLQEYVSARRGQLSFVEHNNAVGQHQPVFQVDCIVDGVVIADATSGQKVLAKKLSARNALLSILAEARANLKIANQIVKDELESEEFICWADYICALSHRVLHIVQTAQLDKYVKEKIVAAFVMTMGESDKGVVVSLGTGNRTILGRHLTTDGTKVHHSHAEVVARRGLLRYLYYELKSYRHYQPHKLFMTTPSGLLRLRPNVAFHLYISRPPCGDASAFINITNTPVPRKQQNKQGLLRCLIEDGEGAIPSHSEPETKGDNRLRLMTCSDKICSWNVLGIQGALLSRLMQPIYIRCIIIGSSVGQQRCHIPRALSYRLSHKSQPSLSSLLPHSYSLNHPVILHVSDAHHSPYELTNSRPYSVNWCLGDLSIEVLQGMTGFSLTQNEETEPSRISKMRLFEQFNKISAKFNLDLCASYTAAKLAAKDYCLSKCILTQRFLSMGYGRWVSLPTEVNDFTLKDEETTEGQKTGDIAKEGNLDERKIAEMQSKFEQNLALESKL